MAENLPGIIALLFVGCVALYGSLRWPEARKAILAAFVLRALLALVHYYVFPLPDGDRDAVTFERVAWEWSQQPIALEDRGDYLISWVLSFLYWVFGRQPLMLQSASVLLGIGTVVAGWVLACELWGKRVALYAAWVLALFPSLLLYSSLVLRGVYAGFFLLLGLIGMVRWFGNKGNRAFLLALFGFGVATLFHGGIGIGVMVFLGMACFQAVKQIFNPAGTPSVRLISLLFFVAGLMPIVAFFSGYLALPKIGYVDMLFDFQNIISFMDFRTDCGSGYPSWLIPVSPLEFLWKSPAIVTYFMFAPFPWDVNMPSHVVGLIDGLLYMVLVFVLWQHRNEVKCSQGALWSFLILCTVIVVYSFGVGNFGTAIRHRAMIVPVLIVLASPGFPALYNRFSVRTHMHSREED